MTGTTDRDVVVHRAVRSADWDAAAPVVVLYLHGYGSHEDDLTGLAPALDLGLPWASLRAPVEVGGGGAAWYAISRPGNPELGPVTAATDALWAWVDREIDPATRIVPIGFSQGGMMATQLLRTRPDRVIAPVVLAGFVLGEPLAGDDALAAARPAAFWGRGAEDQVIAAQAVTRTEAWLPRHTTLTAPVYPGMAHGISSPELADVRAFVLEQLRAAA